MSSIRIERILKRLIEQRDDILAEVDERDMWRWSPETLRNDEDHFRQYVLTEINKGWTDGEILNLYRNMEDWHPTLDEDTALANMKRITDAVNLRLQKERE